MVRPIASSAPAAAGRAACGGLRRPARPGRRRLLAAAAVALAAATAASPVFAHPDAQVEARSRPDFGWLLLPPAWPGGPGPGGPGPGGPGPGGPGPVGPGPGGGPPCRRGVGGACGFPVHGGPGSPLLDHVVVDCTGWRPFMIQRALSLLRPGGVLILRTHGGACIESVFITRSVQIVGDGGPDGFGPYAHAAFPLAHAVLVAPPGQPCISVAPGVRAVSLRGLVINAPGAGGAACIQARDAQVEMRDSVIRYVGGGSPINVEGGIMLLKNLGVAARTPAPAVISEGADVRFEDLRIATSRIGLLVEPGAGVSQLTRVFARALDCCSPDDAQPTTGLAVRGGFSQHGQVDVLDAVMLGFANGVRVDHDVQADLRFGRIGGAKVGVLAEGLVGVRGMTIGAAEVGVYVRTGAAAKVLLNRIYGVRVAAIFAEPGARVWAAGNRVYPGPNCGFLRDPRYNSAGQECRPWGELPQALRGGPANAGSFQDGWREWNYDWGYDPQKDAWRTGVGGGFGGGGGPSAAPFGFGPSGAGPGAGPGGDPGSGPGPGFGGGPGSGPGPGSGGDPGSGPGPGFGGGPGSGPGPGFGGDPGSGPGPGFGGDPGSGPGPGFGGGPGSGPDPGFGGGPGSGPGQGFGGGPGSGPGPGFGGGPGSGPGPGFGGGPGSGPGPGFGGGPGSGPGPGFGGGPGSGPGPGPGIGAGPGSAPYPLGPPAGPTGPAAGYIQLQPGVPTYTPPNWGTQQSPLSPDVYDDPPR